MVTINYNILDVLRDIDYNNENYFIEKSKDNKLILRVKKDNKLTYLGSKYNVSRDAKNFVSEITSKNNNVIIVFGFGTGENIKELSKFLNENNKIIIFEPDINILKLCKDTENFNEIINDNRINLFHYDKNDAKTNLLLTLKDYEIPKIRFLVHTNYGQVYGEELVKFTKILQNTIYDILATKNTSERYSKVWFQCYLENMKHIVNSTPVSFLKDVLKSVPAIIVSAGPSLKNNIKYLKEVEDKFVIISGGRTLKPLLEIGVKPDFICILDSAEISYKLVEYYIGTDVPLVYYELTNYKILDNHKGKKIIVTSDYNVNDVMGIEIGDIPRGGSVAHLCLGLAIELGCNPIMFIGQDFAYTGEKLHAEITEMKTGDNKLELDNTDIYVDDVYGEKVRTSIIFDLYRKAMKDIISNHTGRLYINCTEGGAHIEGTEVMPLKNAISKYNGDFNKDVSVYLNKDNGIDIKQVISKLDETKDTLNKITLLSEDALQYSNEMFKEYNTNNKKINYSNINRIVAKLDKIDKKITSDYEKYMFINTILYPVLTEVMSNGEFLEQSDETEIEAGIRISKKSIFLYKEINKLLKEVVPMIVDCIEKIKTFNKFK